jgi:hypothetical protein
MLTDNELDKLLIAATNPQLPENFDTRLLAKLHPANNVVNFPSGKTKLNWLLAMPLAASLAIGIWIGATDTIASTWFGSSEIAINDTIDATGFDDIVTFVEGKLT